MSFLNFDSPDLESRGLKKSLKVIVGIGVFTGALAIGSTLAANINLNSGVATAATPAKPLSTHSNIKTSSSSTWGNKKRYSAGSLQSIMKRIPMHEPWALHENQAPTLLTPKNTDRDV